jgi:hypothetical protein
MSPDIRSLSRRSDQPAQAADQGPDTSLSMKTTSTSASGTTARPPETLDHDLRVLRRAGWVIVGLGVIVFGFILHQLFLTTWLARANQAELTESARARFTSITVERLPYP